MGLHGEGSVIIFTDRASFFFLYRNLEPNGSAEITGSMPITMVSALRLKLQRDFNLTVAQLYQLQTHHVHSPMADLHCMIVISA